LSEEPVNASSRQAHDVRKGAVDRLDESRAEPLNGVGAGLVARLPGRDVPADLLLVERRDPYPGFFDRPGFGPRVPPEQDGRDDEMLAAGEAPQHPGGFPVVPRLSEYRSVDQDERIGGEDPGAGVQGSGRGGFRARETRGGVPSRLARKDGLVDIRGGEVERDAEGAKDLRAAGRGGGEEKAIYHTVILRPIPFLSFRDRSDEESLPEKQGIPRGACPERRAPVVAQGILRFAQDDRQGEGLGVTGRRSTGSTP